MADDEQRVRTMAGWIGVEISRSRVRTAGKAGYGLYRVRGSVGCAWIDTRGLKRSQVTEDLHGQRGEWTAYAFGLTDIETAVTEAIERGAPAGPGPLRVRRAYPDKDAAIVPTRWTSAYRGRRDLGRRGRAGLCGRPERHVDECLCLADGKARWIEDEPVAVQVKPEFAALVGAVDSLVGAGLVEMVHVDGCEGCGPDRYWAACIRETATDKQRQRAHNQAFQAEHLKAREVGLRARYADKERRLRGTQHSDGQLGPQIGSEGDSGGQG